MQLSGPAAAPEHVNYELYGPAAAPEHVNQHFEASFAHIYALAPKILKIGILRTVLPISAAGLPKCSKLFEISILMQVLPIPPARPPKCSK